MNIDSEKLKHIIETEGVDISMEDLIPWMLNTIKKLEKEPEKITPAYNAYPPIEPVETDAIELAIKEFSKMYDGKRACEQLEALKRNRA
jgi:hypothetical protein